MPERFRKAFFAYPGSPDDLTHPIQTAAQAISDGSGKVAVQIWPAMEIFGASIPNEIRDAIREADVLVCDITRANMNVYYEAGFAIGLGKPIAPVVNSSFANAIDEIQKDGMFDNIKYKPYENSEQLVQILNNLPNSALLSLYGKELNFKQPLFYLNAYRKTNFINSITSAIKDSRVFFRSFDPVEAPRFVTVAIIAEVTSSAGIIIPILAEHIDDAARHNLRAAFLAGISHGLGRDTLLLQAHIRDQALPADYRDEVVTVREGNILELVADFARGALVSAQSVGIAPPKSSKSALQKLSLGASSAENEFSTLQEYFVETSEYVRTLRGEISVVSGRKGSGKTAIFFQVRDRFLESRNSVVVDLKPESHQLSLFRQELLKILDAGIFDHTIAAFWYLVILSEILLTIKRNYDTQSRSDPAAAEKSIRIDKIFATSQLFESGDFTSRINRQADFILQEIEQAKKRREAISAERLTNIVFRGGIAELRRLVREFTDSRTQIILLFDNIDKGWPPTGVDRFDIRLVRLLIETLDKVKRDLHTDDREFMSVVFLRNDIYELLVDDTPDRGKAGQVRIDWTDRAKLKQLIYRRLKSTVGDAKASFENLWDRFFTTTAEGKESFEYCVDHCLMRPRFLINILEYAISNAINRGHQRVEEADFIDAVRQHANYLVDDFGYEIRDASGLPEDLLYCLVGIKKLQTKEEIVSRLKSFKVKDGEAEKAFGLLLWYGVLGVALKDGKERFIYDYDYNFKRLEAELQYINGDAHYVINDALHVALRD
jgi:hypothetical protein